MNSVSFHTFTRCHALGGKQVFSYKFINNIFEKAKYFKFMHVNALKAYTNTHNKKKRVVNEFKVFGCVELCKYSVLFLVYGRHQFRNHLHLCKWVYFCVSMWPPRLNLRHRRYIFYFLLFLPTTNTCLILFIFA